ncbi:DNA translocase FtsK [Vibrio gazogenes]|uniref:DNA translocase FtsK n=1 Tax=Vibrio gazogenes DSM 21264 = NBRC 103151 TaxID=1123492 RepID=A0A1M5DSQ7_VIBGA|nr:DNA translocase FtsK 4TM domain-containing protein [Vibrio gazogenes]USP14860.1 DNA translocase FtsK 4TM domain-containing protein [Vibrio gazogenes]SHF69990.1 DNA segregation ATPase FtsK/SpoIIIE, S-DNA-T family [Vibrio gazogenes DSM 21264] [Vibrio gazogenes DSM 21264 = NBRC 103151]
MFKENKSKVETIIKTRAEVTTSARLNGIQRLKESVLILAVLLSVFFSVALLTFSPADPSWSQTAWGGELHNAGGYIGAWIADTLFFTFGSLAYPLPLVITLLAWGGLRARDEDESCDFMLWGTRLLGFVVVLLTSCGLADINFDDLWYFSSGGVVGDVLSSLALPTFNILGSTLIFLFLWGAGFTLLTGISWLTIVEWLGDQAIAFAQKGVSLFRRGEKETILSPGIESSAALLERDIQNRLSPTEAVVESDYTDTASEPTSDSPGDYSFTDRSLTDNVRRFNIHIPQSEQDVEDDGTQGQQVATDVNDEWSERNKRFSATIEELDKAAQQHDDFAQGDWDDESIEDTSATTEVVNHSFGSVDVDIRENEPTISSLDTLDDEPDRPEVQDESDEDVVAFQNLVSEAKKTESAKQNPFLVQPTIDLPTPTEPLPTLELLYHPEKRENFIDQDMLTEVARLVESKLLDYKIQASVVGIYPGPVITRFELDLAPGVKVSRISGLSTDLARSLSTPAVRVVEVIPGKPYVGLELPNLSRQTVYLSDVVSSDKFKRSKSPTTIVLGQDIAGDAVIADLAKMPHVLVAGTTGSGKSVGVNVMILSMLYKATPEEVRFIMIDPKMLELSIYEGIPHLLSEVVTDMKDAANALRWCVAEMERRYKLMSVVGVRNIKGFNEKLDMAAKAGHPIHDPLWKDGDSMDAEPPLLERLPFIVVVVDEFADLMMVVGKKVEELIARLAQKARAAGIHLILATQRPSVDVITGLIKANIPTRVAFTVSTKTDSRTILDQGGAESLLGMGDMLYLPPGSSHTIRVHGAFASDDDVHAVVNNWKARGKPDYIAEIVSGDQGPEALLPGEQLESDEDIDPLFDQVVEHVVETRRGSVSGVQRRFKIGYNRAARIVEQLEAQGIVSAPGHNGNREVLAPPPIRD